MSREIDSRASVPSRKHTASLIERWVRFELEMDASADVHVGYDAGLNGGWYAVAYYDGHHHWWRIVMDGPNGNVRMKEVVEARDTVCARCEEDLGEGAYYEPGDRSVGISRGWEGCELCIAHAAGEAEGSRADYWANVAEDRRAP